MRRKTERETKRRKITSGVCGWGGKNKPEEICKEKEQQRGMLEWPKVTCYA